MDEVGGAKSLLPDRCTRKRSLTDAGRLFRAGTPDAAALAERAVVARLNGVPVFV